MGHYKSSDHFEKLNAHCMLDTIHAIISAWISKTKYLNIFVDMYTMYYPLLSS